MCQAFLPARRSKWSKHHTRDHLPPRGVGGFGMVEVLVTSSLMLGMMWGVMLLFTNAANAARSVQLRTDFSTLSNSLALVLQNQALCTDALRNGKPTRDKAKFLPDTPPQDPTETLQSISTNGNAIAQVGQRFPAFEITGISLKEANPALRTSPASGQTTYFTQLTVEAKKTGQHFGSDQMKWSGFVYVTAKDAPDGTIQACAMTDDKESDVQSGTATPLKGTGQCIDYAPVTYKPPNCIAKITFAKAFKAPPRVVAAINNIPGLVCNLEPQRTIAMARNVTATGFELVCEADYWCGLQIGWANRPQTCNWIATGS